MTGVPGIELIVGLPESYTTKSDPTKREKNRAANSRLSFPAKHQHPSILYHRPATCNISSVTVVPRIPDSVVSLESTFTLLSESEQSHGRFLLDARALAVVAEWIIEDGRRTRLVAYPNKHGHFRSFSNLFFLSGC